MTHPALIERITRSLAYMLRHQPEQFDLELDEYGFANLEDVVHALNERLGEPVDEEDVHEAVTSGDRVRYEIANDTIRALYGHSIEVKPGEPAKPPALLYVGVSSADAERARKYGLRAGRRRFLHLALTPEDALETGRRTSRDYVVITVHALDAWEEGINFYDRKSLFLSDQIPTQFLQVGDVQRDGYGESSEERQFSPRERQPGRGRGPSRSSGDRGWRGATPLHAQAGDDVRGPTSALRDEPDHEPDHEEDAAGMEIDLGESEDAEETEDTGDTGDPESPEDSESIGEIGGVHADDRSGHGTRGVGAAGFAGDSERHGRRRGRGRGPRRREDPRGRDARSPEAPLRSGPQEPRGHEGTRGRASDPLRQETDHERRRESHEPRVYAEGSRAEDAGGVRSRDVDRQEGSRAPLHGRGDDRHGHRGRPDRTAERPIQSDRPARPPRPSHDDRSHDRPPRPPRDDRSHDRPARDDRSPDRRPREDRPMRDERRGPPPRPPEQRSVEPRHREHSPERPKQPERPQRSEARREQPAQVGDDSFGLGIFEESREKKAPTLRPPAPLPREKPAPEKPRETPREEPGDGGFGAGI